MGELPDRGFVTHSCFARDGVSVLGLQRLAAEAEAFEDAVHEWGRHQELASEHLRQLLTLHGGGPEHVLFAVERDAMSVIEPPVPDLMCCGVALDRDRALCGHEDAACTLRHECTEEVIHRY